MLIMKQNTVGDSFATSTSTYNIANELKKYLPKEGQKYMLEYIDSNFIYFHYHY